MRLTLDLGVWVRVLEMLFSNSAFLHPGAYTGTGEDTAGGNPLRWTSMSFLSGGGG